MKVIISNAVTLNGGDAAILEALITVIKETYGGNTEFIVYDNNPEVASKYYTNINYRKLIYLKYKKTFSGKLGWRFSKFYHYVALKRLMLAAKLYSSGKESAAYALLSKQQKEDFEIYRTADLVVSTGGTLLVENYDLQPRFYDYYFTLALKKPLVFFTQSLGPFKKPENKKHIKEIFNQAKMILLRDEASYNNLKEIDVDVSKAHVCADVVFAVAEPQDLEVAKKKEVKQPPKVAISVRDWPFFKNRSVEEGTALYYSSVAAICEYVVKNLGGEVVFISTCQGIKEYRTDDSKVAAEIYEILPSEVKQRASVNSDFHTPEELKIVMEKFDLVVSTRMHSAIQSLSIGIPVLPIAYEFKTKELFSKLIDRDLILDIETITPESCVETFKRFLAYMPSNRESLFEKVEAERISSLKPVGYLKREVSL
ncbi:polysaccharide pyruvyl transferase family protein [Rufibacter sediminis]|uniref:Polysaccharide pyruvyl transferase family protein n=1 Tax=Rufibacter sediminis TaxID=2762756 RepID=A0ABR6VMT6_9BACT|nr:polysaccharide pyruvyl transferase family protein [Rufibacter sediminis]MBC3538504.1 polysaccharide pyruvyl transferase family protein [Rufibacter sediminis]